MKNKKRIKCLTPNELAYLLLVSSVVTGCTQKVEKLPDYEAVYNYCKENDSYCKEQEKLDNAVTTPLTANPNQPLSSNYHSTNFHSSSGSFLNYYLMYHLFFSNSGRSYSNPYYAKRFTNYQEKDKEYSKYRGTGVYSPTYLHSMRNSISSGKTSYTTSSGSVFKSSRYAGSSQNSITGRSISRGGFGSTGRSFSGGRGFGG